MAKMIILEVAFSTASSIDVVAIPLSTNKCLKIFGRDQTINKNIVFYSENPISYQISHKVYLNDDKHILYY